MSEGLGSFLPPLVARILADASQFKTEMGEAAVEAETMAKKGESSFSRLATVGKAALLGLGGAAIGLGVEAVHLADKWEVSHARMATAIKNAGASMPAWQSQISATEKKMAALGFTNADVEGSIATMVTGTKSVQKSLQMQGLVADIARVKNVSLSDASMLVTKSYEGNSRALKALGINQNVAAGSARNIVTSSRAAKTAQINYNQALATFNAQSSHTLANHQALAKAKRTLTIAQKNLSDSQSAGNKIITAMSNKMGGQASAYADTFSGRLEVLKAKTENLAARIGVALVPKLEDVVNWTMDVINWFSKHSTAAKALAATIGGVLAVAIAAYIAKLTIAAAQSVANFAKMVASGVAWAAEQVASLSTVAVAWATSMVEMATEATVWAAAMLAAGAEALLPFAPIIAVVALVAIGAYELYKHWNTVWGFIKKISADALDFIKSHLTLIVTVVLGPIGLAALELYKHWNTVWTGIKDVASTAYEWVRSHLPLIISIALGPIGVAALELYKHWGTVWNGIQSLVQDVWSVIKPIFDSIISAADKVSGAVGKVASVAGKVGGFVGKINPFAEGTNNAPGGLAVVGEKGPELVNLPKGSKVTPADKTKKILARYTPKATPEPLVDRAFQGVSDGLSTALVRGLNRGRHAAVARARRDAERLAASTIVGTGKNAHHLTSTQQSRAVAELMKAAVKTHREDVKSRIAAAKAAKVKHLAPHLTHLGSEQTSLGTTLTAQAARAAQHELSKHAAGSALDRARAQIAAAKALAKATKGLSDHGAAMAALKKATENATAARRDANKALRDWQRSREYRRPASVAYSSNAGSFLAATVAAHSASTVPVTTVVTLDGKTLWANTQKHTLRKNGRNPTNRLSTRTS